jgi:hypothetical protein
VKPSYMQSLQDQIDESTLPGRSSAQAKLDSLYRRFPEPPGFHATDRPEYEQAVLRLHIALARRVFHPDYGPSTMASEDH